GLVATTHDAIAERAEAHRVQADGVPLAVGMAAVTAHDSGRDSCVDAEECLVQLLRIVEDGRSNLVRRPLGRAAVRILRVGGVTAEGLEPIAGRIEEVDRRAPRDPMTAGP